MSAMFSYIPGSISKKEFNKSRSDYRDHKIVAYCTIGYRSGLFASKLQKENFDVVNLKGSILSWVNAGQPVITSDGSEIKKVHVYGKKWDLLPEGYEGMY